MRLLSLALAALCVGCAVPDISIADDAAAESEGSSDAGDAGDAVQDAPSDTPTDGAVPCPDAMPPSATTCCPNGQWCGGSACGAKCMLCGCSATFLCCAKNMGMNPSCAPLDAGCP